MKKTVIVEKLLKNYLKSLKSDVIVPGLILGQNSTDHDFVVHLARTQIPSDARGSVCYLKQITNLKEKWILDHIRNVISMLPGGMTVLGLFFVSESDIFSNPSSEAVLKKILSAINNFIQQNDYCFVKSGSDEKLILNYYDDTSLTCKRFLSTRADGYFDSVECILNSSNWHHVSCYYDFEHLLPLYVKSMSNAILHDKIMDILKYVSKSVKESVLVFNGEIRNNKTLIECIEERKESDMTKNSVNSQHNQIQVDLYAPCVLQDSNKSSEISDYIAELKCFGTLCCDVYLHNKATVEDVVQAVKEDIIRSLYSRLTMHCNSLLEDLNTSTPDETWIIHEPPRRISVSLPFSQVRFTDYLFPGDESMNTLPAPEQLDIRITDNDQNLYVPLEIESDAAAEFHDSEIKVKSNEKSEGFKSQMRYTIILSILISLLVTLVAILFQKYFK